MTANKLHRWLDLLAALLSRRAPVTFAELAREVPGYADAVLTSSSWLERS